jgi:hypothetical protein
MIVTAADCVRLPALSTATALTVYDPGGSGPVFHHVVPEHVVVLHGRVAKTFPPPQSSMRARPTLSVALAATRMLAPVHTVPVGVVMETVGSTVSVVLPPPLLVVPVVGDVVPVVGDVVPVVGDVVPVVGDVVPVVGDVVPVVGDVVPVVVVVLEASAPEL